MAKRLKSKPLLPPTDVNSCGPRCLTATFHFPNDPITVTLHNVSPGWQVGIAVVLTALSTPS